MNFKDSEKNLFQLNKQGKRVFLKYIGIGMLFGGSVTNLIIGIKLNDNVTFLVALYFALLGWSLMDTVRTDEENCVLLNKMKKNIDCFEKRKEGGTKVSAGAEISSFEEEIIWKLTDKENERLLKLINERKSFYMDHFVVAILFLTSISCFAISIYFNNNSGVLNGIFFGAIGLKFIVSTRSRKRFNAIAAMMKQHMDGLNK